MLEEFTRTYNARAFMYVAVAAASIYGHYIGLYNGWWITVIVGSYIVADSWYEYYLLSTNPRDPRYRQRFFWFLGRVAITGIVLSVLRFTHTVYTGAGLIP